MRQTDRQMDNTVQHETGSFVGGLHINHVQHAHFSHIKP